MFGYNRYRDYEFPARPRVDAGFSIPFPKVLTYQDRRPWPPTYPKLEGEALRFWKRIDSILREKGIITNLGISSNYLNEPFALTIANKEFNCRLKGWGMSWMVCEDMAILFYYPRGETYHNGRHIVELCAKVEFFADDECEIVKFILTL